MHARHRNLPNGFRSNPVGIGPGYRSFNRTGFGRAGPRIFQSGPPPAPPRRFDVFMEAGKLATEYLVSKGLLPPNSIRARRTIESFKNPGFESNQKHGKDVSTDLESKSYDLGKVETTVENKQNQFVDNVGSNAPISVESKEKTDCSKNLDTKEVNTDDSKAESEEPSVTEEAKNGSGSDLLTLIRFNKVPKRTRSSLSLKGSRINEKTKDNQDSEHVSVLDAQQDKKQGLNIQEASSMEEIVEFDHDYKLPTRSQSFPQRSTLSDQELAEKQHVLGRLEKRPLHFIDNENDAKKPCNSYAEEKQLFPASFKICDLNLMEVSDANENHDKNSVISFQSIRQPKREPVSVDFDLSMSGRHTRRGTDGKEVEVIDLDCDSVQVDKVFSNSDRKEETIFTDLESFPDSMPRVSEMPQDGYGLMISELLEADIPTSSVPTGVNSMHNQEGILGDDESIYMSLGEIPISFVPVWDQQPSRGYDKRY